MIEFQDLREIDLGELIAEVQKMWDAGYRLVQIGATRTDIFEVNYSFDRELKFVNFKINLADNSQAIPSVSGSYWNAFLYENELHDLFGLKIENINIDYRGNFYKVARPAAFAEKPVAAPKIRRAAKPVDKAGTEEADR